MSDAEIPTNENIENSAENSLEIVTTPVERELVTDTNERMAIVEALLFAHGEPLAVGKIAEISAIPEDEIGTVLEAIKLRHAGEQSGFELLVVAEQYQFRTKPQFANYVRELRAGVPRRLSAPALETLAIIAYRQPIVRSDIERIRGVDATPTIKTLLDRNLIRIIGHQAGVGQPALFGTTDEFLKLFGLKSLAELPTLRDLKELERDPGEESEGQSDEETTSTAAPQAEEPGAEAIAAN
jgi:segregation and condensation protein B